MSDVSCKECGRQLKDRRRRACPDGSGCKAQRTHLRAVEPGESPADLKPKPRKMTVVEAIANGGTELEILYAMRDRVGDAVGNPNCPPRDLAALTRRLHEIMRDIAALEAQESEEAEGAANTPDEDWSEEAI